MLRIGITGGIGSGKTTAARLFSELGVMVYYTDVRSRHIITYNQDVVLAIKERYGDDIYTDKRIDGPRLAEIIFNDREELQWMNRLMYPHILAEFKEWCKTWKSINHDHLKEGNEYTLIESAILVESGAIDEVDAVIAVMCPVGVRIKRAMERDKLTREQVEARVANQISDEERLANSDFVIWNTGSEEYLEAQVKKIHDEIRYHSK